MPIKLANNASGTLATAISASDTGVALTTGNGALFPTLAAGEYFYATLTSSANTQEIVKATARSGDSLTIVRAQEGTAAQSFAAGARFELRVTTKSITDTIYDITRYQGASATNPTVRLNGEPLIVGDFYFNTGDNSLRFYNGSAWQSVVSGSITIQQFSGNGVSMVFTFSTAPSVEAVTQVYINGVYQQKDTYALVGAVLTFSQAPVAGTGNIEVVVIEAVAIGTLASSSVTHSAAVTSLLTATDAKNALDDLSHSSTGSTKVGFLQAGTGATSRTVQAKLRESVSVLDFGTIGNSTTGDDAVLQLAIDYLHRISNDSGVQGVITFEGSLYLAGQIKMGKNVTLRGKGRNFRSQIVPLASWTGTSLFSHDGDDCIGGFAFRIRHEGYTVNCSALTLASQLPIVYNVNKAYDITFNNIWIYEGLGTGIHIEDANWVVIDNCSLYGQQAVAANANIGIRVASGGTTNNAAGGVKVINSDIEVWFTGVSVETDGRCELTNPYIERCITGWKTTNTAFGTMLVTGGQIESPGASGTAANIGGPNCTVVGGYYAANGGNGLFNGNTRFDNVNLLGVAGVITDARNLTTKQGLDTTNWYESVVRNYKAVDDNVATTFFTVVVPNLATHQATLDVRLDGRDASGQSMWTANYRVAFNNCDGSLTASAVTEYAKSAIDVSANYTLAITCAASISGTTLSFVVTANTGGALGAGTQARISTEAQLVQWSSTGAVYMAAA